MEDKTETKNENVIPADVLYAELGITQEALDELQACFGMISRSRLSFCKDITTTMNIYSHVRPSSAREAADKIGQLVYFTDAG